MYSISCLGIGKVEFIVPEGCCSNQANSTQIINGDKALL